MASRRAALQPGLRTVALLDFSQLATTWRKLVFYSISPTTAVSRRRRPARLLLLSLLLGSVSVLSAPSGPASATALYSSIVRSGGTGLDSTVPIVYTIDTFNCDNMSSISTVDLDISGLEPRGKFFEIRVSIGPNQLCVAYPSDGGLAAGSVGIVHSDPMNTVSFQMPFFSVFLEPGLEVNNGLGSKVLFRVRIGQQIVQQNAPDPTAAVLDALDEALAENEVAGRSDVVWINESLLRRIRDASAATAMIDRIEARIGTSRFDHCGGRVTVNGHEACQDGGVPHMPSPGWCANNHDGTDRQARGFGWGGSTWCSLFTDLVGDSLYDHNNRTSMVRETGGTSLEAYGLSLFAGSAVGAVPDRGVIVDSGGPIYLSIISINPEINQRSLVPGSVVEVWINSQPRLVAAARVPEDGGTVTFAVPTGAPLDGGGPIEDGKHTLVLRMYTTDGFEVVATGITIGQVVPTRIPAGEGPVPSGAVVLALLAAAGAVVAGRRLVTAG